MVRLRINAGKATVRLTSADAPASCHQLWRQWRRENECAGPKFTEEGEELLEIGAGLQTLVGDNLCFRFGRGFEVREMV